MDDRVVGRVGDDYKAALDGMIEEFKASNGNWRDNSDSPNTRYQRKVLALGWNMESHRTFIQSAIRKAEEDTERLKLPGWKKKLWLEVK